MGRWGGGTGGEGGAAGGEGALRGGGRGNATLEAYEAAMRAVVELSAGLLARCGNLLSLTLTR